MSLDLSKLQCVKHGSDNTVTAACPSCRARGSDRAGNHLKVWLSTGAFHCIVDDSREHNREIRALIRGEGGVDIEYIQPEEKLTVDPVYPESMLDKLLKDHSYWVNRGVKPEVIEMLEGGISPNDARHKLSNRYIIPIRGLSGQINGWSGRILGDSTFAVKYKHLFKSSRVCWPWHIAGPHIIKSRKVVLQEGWSEWLFLHGSGIHNSLSLFGLNISSVLISQLLAHGVEKVIISTNDDPDDGKIVNGRVQRKGKLRALDIRTKLLNFWSEDNVIIRHPKSDWGEATEDERQAFRAEIEAL